MKEDQITLEESQANHNEWWDSLTNEDKERLYNEQKEAEEYFHNIKQPSLKKMKLNLQKHK